MPVATSESSLHLGSALKLEQPSKSGLPTACHFTSNKYELGYACKGTLPQAVVGKAGIGCMLQPWARCHMSMAIHRNGTMAGSSFIRDNVPPHIQSGIDTSAKSSWHDH